MNQIINSIRQVKQNLNKINQQISQMENEFSQENSHLGNLSQNFNNHLNEIQQISQMFNQSFQELDNCERIVQNNSVSSTPTTNYSTSNPATSTYGGNSYPAYNQNQNYRASANTTNFQNSGYKKQYYPSQNPTTVSMNTRDKDIGPGYYNMKSNNNLTGTNNLYNTAQTTGMNNSNPVTTSSQYNPGTNQFTGMNNNLRGNQY